MAKLTDLKPFPSTKELSRAMKNVGDTREISRQEFNDKLVELILAERKQRAEIVTKMLRADV